MLIYTEVTCSSLQLRQQHPTLTVTQEFSVSHFWAGSVIRSLSRKRRSKKSCTSSRRSGPPMFNIKIPVLGFLWKQEIFQILVTYCFFLLLLQNNQLPLLHLFFAKAASYLEAWAAYVKIWATSMNKPENKYLHDLYFFKKSNHFTTQSLTGNILRKLSCSWRL